MREHLRPRHTDGTQPRKELAPVSVSAYVENAALDGVNDQVSTASQSLETLSTDGAVTPAGTAEDHAPVTPSTPTSSPAKSGKEGPRGKTTYNPMSQTIRAGRTTQVPAKYIE